MSGSDAAVTMIAQATRTYYECRRKWLQARHTGDSQAAAAELHNSVLNLYLALHPYRDHGAVEPHWQEATVRVEGAERPIDSLAAYLEDEVVESPKTMFDGADRKRQQRLLEPSESLESGQTLTRLARYLGVDIDVEETEEYEQEYAHLAE